jgi:rhodanese-related sulfurtransferase
MATRNWIGTLMQGRPDGVRAGLRAKARGVAIRVLGMEFDTEERRETARPTSTAFDPSVIPKIVDGDGDTPGPNHKEDIGRPWLAAQVAGGVSPLIVDIRPLAEVVGGTLPGAHLLPQELIWAKPELIPGDKGGRLIIYDQTGEQGANETAAWLREQGWVGARRLRGGFAEWLEHDEPVSLPSAAPGGQLRPGDPARTPKGEEARVWRVLSGKSGPAVELLLPDGRQEGPLDERELRS